MLLFLLMVGVTTGGAYAYWAGTVHNPDNALTDYDIVIGEGAEVHTELNLSEALNATGKKLVPVGKVGQSAGGSETNTDTFEVTYNVLWREKEGTDILKVQDEIRRSLNFASAVTIGGKTANAELFTVTFNPADPQITAEGAAVPVTVTVRMTEPGTKAIYDQVAGANVNVNLTFSVSGSGN